MYRAETPPPHQIVQQTKLPESPRKRALKRELLQRSRSITSVMSLDSIVVDPVADEYNSEVKRRRFARMARSESALAMTNCNGKTIESNPAITTPGPLSTPDRNRPATRKEQKSMCDFFSPSKQPIASPETKTPSQSKPLVPKKMGIYRHFSPLNQR